MSLAVNLEFQQLLDLVFQLSDKEKLLLIDCLNNSFAKNSNEKNDPFSAFKIQTEGFVFNRDEANER